MYIGATLAEVQERAHEISRNARDYVVRGNEIEMKLEDDVFSIATPSMTAPMRLTELAHAQLRDRVGIPAAYYNKMRTDAPDLLLRNVNHWLDHNNELTMVRAVEGQDPFVRAFLSDRYQRVDNAAFLKAILPVVNKHEGAQVRSCAITDARMYLKVTFPKTAHTFPVLRNNQQVGEQIEYGWVITNSEVGLGARRIAPFIYTLACTNGLVVSQALGSFARRHIGSKASVSQYVLAPRPADDLERDNDAFAAKAAVLLEEQLAQNETEAIARAMTALDQIHLGDMPDQVVINLSKKYFLSSSEEVEITSLLFEDPGTLTMYALLNAVTHAAENASSYDRATELEAVGGQMLRLTQGEIKSLLTIPTKK